MSIFAIFLVIVIAFTCGMVGGVLLGYDTAAACNDDKRTCDMCDQKIPEKDSLFCGECFEEESEDQLGTALKQKEGTIRYKSATLRQRTVIDKPTIDELKVLEKDSDEVDELCDGVERVSNTLKLEVNLQPLREQNKGLKSTVQKWQIINEREDAVNRILQDEF